MKFNLHQFKQGQWNVPPDRSLDSPKTLILIFSAAKKEGLAQVLTELKQVFSHSICLGCSTAGEIFQDEIFDQSISVAILKFDSTVIKQTTQSISDVAQSFKVGEALVNDLPKQDLKAIFVLSDGLTVNGSALVEGMTSNLSSDVIVSGGLAGDGDRFEQTYVIANFSEKPSMITAVAFYGDSFCVGHGSRGGWDIMGVKREVTRSNHNVLYELDGQPALTLYKKYLGERASELPASGLLFPLALHHKNGSEDTVRTILAVNEDEQSITFAGDIPEGLYVSLMYANFDRLIDGASKAANNIMIEGGCQPTMLAIAISCVGRRLVLGQRCEEEVETTLEAFPKGTQQVGFYSYGEISPLTNGQCDLHNQTMTLTLIGEK